MCRASSASVVALGALLGMTFAGACSNDKRAPREERTCNRDEMKARRKWLDSKSPSDNGTPRQYGFAAEGFCLTIVRSKGFECDLETVQSVEGHPAGWLADAQKLGFTTYACETLEGKRSEYPISDIVVDVATLAPMTLPTTKIQASKLLGEKLSNVPHSFGKPSVSGSEHDYALDGGAKLRLYATKKRIVRLVLFVDGFVEGRDGPELLSWLGVEDGKVDGEPVIAEEIGGGVSIEVPPP